MHEACEPNAFVDLVDSEGVVCKDGRDVDFLVVQADAMQASNQKICRMAEVKCTHDAI